MRAVVVEQPGGPDALVVRERPTPDAAPDAVVVDVAAAGVNYIDVYHRNGAYPLALPFVAGSEGAGVVSAVGADVRDVAVGDRVAWAMVPGTGYAEQVAVPATRVVPVPAGVELETAAAVMLQGMTAHYLTASTYPVAEGDDVVVHAAAGGVGLLLTQMATARGGRVIGTASTPEKAELAVGAGAVAVIPSADASVDLASEIRRLTNGRGAHVIYDGVGAATFTADLDALRPRGMLVLYGAASGPVPPFDPQLLNAKGSLYLTRPSLAHYISARSELVDRASAVLDAVATGALNVRVGGRYALKDAPQAHRDLESRASSGKLLLIP